MQPGIQEKILALHEADADARRQAFLGLMHLTDRPVDWTYEVWEQLLAMLGDKNNHRRSIAAQLLANLAKSDPEQRMPDDFHQVYAVTYDPRFVTARHALQCLWKIALAKDTYQTMVMDVLSRRYKECLQEKNSTLIRYDIMVVMHKIFETTGDETVKKSALSLIELEEDLKYRKKYTSAWKTA